MECSIGRLPTAELLQNGMFYHQTKSQICTSETEVHCLPENKQTPEVKKNNEIIVPKQGAKLQWNAKLIIKHYRNVGMWMQQ